MFVRLMRAHPNLMAVALGGILALGLLTLAEVIAYCLIASRPAAPAEGWQYEYAQQPLTQPHPLYGFAPTPNATVPVRRTKKDIEAYEVTWTTDALARRTTPVPPGTPEAAALFFGCSFTFGEAVEDTETLPALFSQQLPKYRSLNYAYMGYGPQHTFLQLEDTEVFSDLSLPVGLVIYTLIPHQIDRLIGRMRLSTGWGGALPYLRVEDGTLVHRGSFRESRGLRQRLYSIASRSALLKYLRMDIPRKISEEQYRFTAKVLAATAEKSRVRFPGARFLVLLYPTRWSTGNLNTLLREQGLEVVELQEFLPPDFATAPAYNLPDQHPTAEAYALVAQALKQWLQKHPAP